MGKHTCGYCRGGNNGSGKSSGKKGCSSGLLYLPTCSEENASHYLEKMLVIISRSLTYLCMKLFSLRDHKFNQRSIESIHGENILIIGISIITILCPFQKDKYNTIFLSDQRVPYTLQGQAFTLVHPFLLQSTCGRGMQRKPYISKRPITSNKVGVVLKTNNTLQINQYMCLRLVSWI